MNVDMTRRRMKARVAVILTLILSARTTSCSFGVEIRKLDQISVGTFKSSFSLTFVSNFPAPFIPFFKFNI